MKPLMQAVEAVADAQTGELERLKEFGITKSQLIEQARKMGEGEVVNAKGQITNQEGLNKALFALMQSRYKGGMALQAQTFNGMISNVKDAMGTMGRELSKPLFEKLKQGLVSVVPIMSAATSAIKGDWIGVKQTLNDSFGPEVALKIENVFLAVGAGVNRAKQFISDLQPTVQNLISIFNNLKPILADIGKAIGAAFLGLLEVLPPLLEKITAIVDAVTSWKGFIPTISGVAAAVASYKGMMTLLTEAQALYDKVVKASALIQRGWRAAVIASQLAGGGLKGVLAGMRAAMVAMNLTMLANPFVLVAALLIGLGVAFVQAYRHSETFRNIVNGAWASIKVGFAAFISFFTTTLPAWVASVVGWFNQLKAQATASFMSLWSAAKAYFNAGMTGLRALIAPFVTFFVNSWNNLKLLVLSITTLFFSILTGDFQGVKLALLGIWTALKNQLMNVWNLLKSTLIAGAISIGTGIKNGFVGAKNAVISTVTSLYQGAINLFNRLKSGAVNAVNSTKSGIVNGFNSAKTSAVSAVTGLYNGVVSWFQRVPGKVTEMKNSMISTLKGINLYQMGKDAIQGFVNGIGSMVGAVKNKVKDITEGLKSKLKSALKMGSPSKLLEQYGTWTFEGFVIGADSMIGDIKDVAARAAQAVIPNASNFDLIGSARNVIGNIPANLAGAGGATSEVHNHYWNVNADEINEVSKLVRMVNSLRQDGRRS